MTRRHNTDEDTFDPATAVPVESLGDILQAEQSAAILESEARHRALLSASVPEYRLPELRPGAARVLPAADPWPGHLDLEEQRELGQDGPPEQWQALSDDSRRRLVGLASYIISICPRPADARLAAQRRDKLPSVIGAVIYALSRGQVLDGLDLETRAFCEHFVVRDDHDARERWRDLAHDIFEIVGPGRDGRLFRELFTRLDREAGAVESIRGAVARAVERVRARWAPQPADERA